MVSTCSGVQLSTGKTFSSEKCVIPARSKTKIECATWSSRAASQMS